MPEIKLTSKLTLQYPSPGVAVQTASRMVTPDNNRYTEYGTAWFLSKSVVKQRKRTWLQEIAEFLDNMEDRAPQILNNLPKDQNGLLKRDALVCICYADICTNSCGTWTYPAMVLKISNQRTVSILLRRMQQEPYSLKYL